MALSKNDYIDGWWDNVGKNEWREEQFKDGEISTKKAASDKEMERKQDEQK